MEDLLTEVCSHRQHCIRCVGVCPSVGLRFTDLEVRCARLVTSCMSAATSDLQICQLFCCLLRIKYGITFELHRSLQSASLLVSHTQHPWRHYVSYHQGYHVPLVCIAVSVLPSPYFALTMLKTHSAKFQWAFHISLRCLYPPIFPFHSLCTCQMVISLPLLRR